MVRIARDVIFFFPSKDGKSMMCPTHGNVQRPPNLNIQLGVPYYCNNTYNGKIQLQVFHVAK